MTLSVGKLRGLQQCTTPDGLFLIMALDHRQDLRAAINPANPDSISYSELALFKTEVARALSPVSSAVLLDPEFGAAQAIAAGALTGSSGLIVSLEENGPTDKPSARKAHILTGWSVEQVRRMGAAAAKLLVTYNPNAKNASDQELAIRDIAADCRDHDLTFFLEPVAYPVGSGVRSLSAEDESAIAIETARRLSPLGADVYIASLPAEAGEASWAATCAALNEACATPWVLRSGHADYELFVRQAEVAGRAGASGVVAGTAVWLEAVALRGDEQIEFLNKTAVERMVELGDIIAEYATSWTEYYQSGLSDIPAGWYESY